MLFGGKGAIKQKRWGDFWEASLKLRAGDKIRMEIKIHTGDKTGMDEESINYA